MYLRKVKLEDSVLLFNWANDDAVRANAVNQEPIEWQGHQHWFNNKLNDPNSKLYILEDDNRKPVGQIRFDKDDKTNAYWITYSIEEKYRGKGFGKCILDLGIKKLQSAKLLALVRRENMASLKLFKSLGFKEMEERGVKNDFVLFLLDTQDDND